MAELYVNYHVLSVGLITQEGLQFETKPTVLLRMKIGNQ